jgi:PKD repeat protein
MPSTVTWSGYTWDVRQQGLSGPGPNYWSNLNVAISGTELVLTVQQQTGQWRSAEVDCQTHLGYGTYTWVVNTDLSTIDTYEVLGLFTYGDTPPHNNEIDIEAARWGNPGGPAGEWTVYQTTGGNATAPFNWSTHPPYTCRFKWEPGKVTYTITDGLGATLLSQIVTASVPAPGIEVPVINYWRFVEDENYANYIPPTGPKSIRIASFTYAPLSGGGSAPVADFTGSALTGTAPLGVTFTDASTNTPTSWLWNFGDGGTSTSQNPSHTYAAAGTYTVTLTATNATGSDTKTRTSYITVTAVGPPVTGSRVRITEAVMQPTPDYLQPVTGAQVQVNIHGAGAATVYRNETGTSTVANPLTTRNGRIEPPDEAGGDVWLDPGRYDLVVTYGAKSYLSTYEAVSGGIP